MKFEEEKQFLLSQLKTNSWFRGIGIKSTPARGVYKLSIRVIKGKEQQAKTFVDSLGVFHSIVDIEVVAN